MTCLASLTPVNNGCRYEGQKPMTAISAISVLAMMYGLANGCAARLRIPESRYLRTAL